MKSIVIAFGLLCCGIRAENQGTPNVRVSLQLVEMAHPVMSELLGGGDSSGDLLHTGATALVKQGKAKVLETCVLVCRSGNKATTESMREEIFPTEYPGSLQWNVAPTQEQLATVPPTNPMLRAIMAFETRNAGVTFEVEPTVNWDERIIDLRLAPEFVDQVRLDTWMAHKDQWGDASIRMPVFETLRTEVALTMLPGKFELVTSLTPKQKSPVPAVSRKILVFVRADVVPFPVSP
jgi:hypothetical protein